MGVDDDTKPGGGATVPEQKSEVAQPKVRTPSKSADAQLYLNKKVCPGHTKRVNEIWVPGKCVSVPPGGITGVGADYFITACHDQTAMLRSFKTGDWIGTYGSANGPEKHRGAVWSLDGVWDTGLLVTGCADYYLRFFSIETGACFVKLDTQSVVKSCRFSDRGARYLACGGYDSVVKVYDVHEEFRGRAAYQTPKQIDHIKDLGWECDRRFWSTTDNSPIIKCWDIRSGCTRPVEKIELPGDTVVSMEVDKLRRRIIAVSRTATNSYVTEYKMPLADDRTPQLVSSHDLGEVTVECCTWVDKISPTDREKLKLGNSGLFVTGELANYHGPKRPGRSPQSHDLRFWSVQSGEQVGVASGHHGSIYSLTTTPEGSIISGSDDSTVRTWDKNPEYLEEK